MEDGTIIPLQATLFGPVVLRWADGSTLPGFGAKHIAMFAMLATSPGQVRGRAWLADRLWGRVSQQLARSSLRQALNTMRHRMGDSFDLVFNVESDRISLRPGAVELTGGPDLGDFLEGFDIAEEGFEDWLREQRMSADPSPAQPAPPSPAYRHANVTPAIAVLPFLILGADQRLDGAGDYVAQEIIRAISRTHIVDVISHLSSRSMGAPTLALHDIKAALQPDFIVTGSLRLMGERFILQVDLIDCDTGHLVWEERFSVPISTFFEPQSRLFLETAGEVVRAVLSEAVQFGAFKPLPDLPAHRLLMSAISLMFHVSKDQFVKSRAHLDELAERRLPHSTVHAWSAQWHLLHIYQGWSADPTLSRRLATDNLAAGLDANPECAMCLAIDGNVKTVLDADFNAASMTFERSLAINNSSALTNALKCVLHTFLGDGKTAIAHAERSNLLSPRDPRKHFFESLHASACLVDHDFAKAVELADSALRASPHHISAHRTKVIGLSRAGRMEEASEAVSALMRLAPNMTVSSYLQNHSARHTGVANDWADALLEAGVPD